MNLVVGNVYTYAAGGVMFRVGDNLKRDLSPPNIRPGFPGLAYFRGGDESSWYLFLGFESRLVARDIFLDGNTFKDSHSVEKEKLVGDMQFGLVYQVNRWRFAFSNMLRTKEFATQEDNTITVPLTSHSVIKVFDNNVELFLKGASFNSSSPRGRGSSVLI